MMTRKDYVSTAEILNNLYLDSPISSQEILDEAITAFADMFQADNDRFLRQRFIDECYAPEVD